MSAMTNNEAIGILAIVVETAKGRCFVTDEAISDAYDMAISALKAQEAKVQLSAEGTTNLQPTCNQLATDTISRQAAVDAVEESRRLNHHQDGKAACAHEYEHRHFLKILRDLPSAQPDGWLEQNKDKVLQAGMEGREIDFRIGGRLFAIREKAQ